MGRQLAFITQYVCKHNEENIAYWTFNCESILRSWKENKMLFKDGITTENCDNAKIVISANPIKNKIDRKEITLKSSYYIKL